MNKPIGPAVRKVPWSKSFLTIVLLIYSWVRVKVTNVIKGYVIFMGNVKGFDLCFQFKLVIKSVW